MLRTMKTDEVIAHEPRDRNEFKLLAYPLRLQYEGEPQICRSTNLLVE